MTKYDYEKKANIGEANTLDEAIRISVVNYMHHQLGWSIERCKERIQREIDREIPSGLFDQLQKDWDWTLEDCRVLDVGAGQGAAVLEALTLGADAHGVEPGEEFVNLARRRLKEHGFKGKRIVSSGGEALPYPDESFDYVVSLRVLEHVKNPLPLLEEMYRVLRPGGRAYVACENYLAFREQHYRVPWLPLLPKPIGSIYLRVLGRDPAFLQKYVFYTTYPQIWRDASRIGFDNITHRRFIRRVRTAKQEQGIIGILNRNVPLLPRKVGDALLKSLRHLADVFRTGVRLHLIRPPGQDE